eukprot:2543201-Rhodomonas_salina.3
MPASDGLLRDELGNDLVHKQDGTPVHRWSVHVEKGEEYVPESGSTVRQLIKVTGDAREVMNNGTLHTELMCVLLYCENIKNTQMQQHHFTISVYSGKDDHEGLWDNCLDVLQQLEAIEEWGWEQDGYHVMPQFVLPADMATHWGLYGCSGVHDTLFCHRCNTHRDQRSCLYDWVELP